MPPDATAGDRLVLFVLAEQARDSTQLCWPGTDSLMSRTGMADGSIRRIVRRLVAFGLLERVPSGTDCNGSTIYAHRGHRTTYKITPPTRMADPSDRLSTDAADLDGGPVRRSDRSGFPPRKADPSDRLTAGKGGPVGPERRTHGSVLPPVRRPHGSALPSVVQPVSEPSSARATPDHRAVVRDALRERTGKEIPDEYADAVAREVLDGRHPRSPERYLRAAIEREMHPERWLPTPTPPRYRREA
ncbi:helix-turn-helix domain-containing protein [Pseudonocardia alni]|uniref:helix-turn-helix domain-containing protein n=1 Tax=Pseudonocardia alni TaxID=33907 RepID=UPI00340AF9E9